MKIGAVYPQIELGGDPEAVRRYATAAEELGYDHLLVYDHVLGAVHADRQPPLRGPYDEDDPFHDPFVMLSHVAALTERIELVTGVIILPQRQTVLVARQAADVDLLSGGRLRLGVGVGWNHVEYDALGEDFATRGARANEQIPQLRQLWSGEVVSYDGAFDQVDRARLVPAPKRQIPVWVGGFGEAAYRRGARLGDGFIFAGDVGRIVDGWRSVRGHLEREGRSVAGFGAEMLVMRTEGAAGVAEVFDRWRDEGGTHASVITMGRGLDGVEAHIAFLADARAALDAR